LFTNNAASATTTYSADFLLNFRYFAYGEERAPTTGHFHHQGYCVVERRTTAVGLADLFRKEGHLVHIGDKVGGSCRGTHKECVDYCLKEGITHILKDEYIGRGEKKTCKWSEALSLAGEGSFGEIDPQIQISQYKNLRLIYSEKATAEDLTEPCGIWIHGPPGFGKSWMARKTLFPEYRLYLKNPNKWWCNYQGEEKVLIEDMDHDKAN